MNKIHAYLKKLIRESINNLEGFNVPDDIMLEVLKGYIEAALWTEEERLKEDYDEMNPYNDDNEIDDDEDDEIEKIIKLKHNLNSKSFETFTTEDIDPDSRIQAYLDIKKFIKDAGQEAITEALEENDEFRLGMDIWLTRNGHGSGFFDHNYEFEKELETAAHNLKSVDLYIGDNGLLYFSNAN